MVLAEPFEVGGACRRRGSLVPLHRDAFRDGLLQLEDIQQGALIKLQCRTAKH